MPNQSQQTPVYVVNIYIFWDPCHMIKLVRNALAETGDFKDAQGLTISWNHIEQLHDVETKEGLRAGTKLTKKHILFQDTKMNVRLAAQTLSESTSCALAFLNFLSAYKSPDMSGTSKFCLVINNVFDILNCRSKYGVKPFCKPLSKETEEDFHKTALEMEIYISTLTWEKVVLKPKKNSNEVTVTTQTTNILESPRKTGFLGLIICLRNVFRMSEVLKKKQYDYLLSYKLNQDHLETFFSAVRSRGGYNDNPNSFQFQSAYRALLIHNEVRNTSENSNINLTADDLGILTVSSSCKRPCTILDKLISETEVMLEDSNPDDPEPATMEEEEPVLSEFNLNTVPHIAGFVSRKVSKSLSHPQNKKKCIFCANAVIGDREKTASQLFRQKDRGRFTPPSEDAVIICAQLEKMFVKRTKDHLKPNFKHMSILNVLSKIGNLIFNDQHMMEHHELTNHRLQLIVHICDSYLTIRIHHESTKAVSYEKFIRQKNTKVVHFNGQ